MRVILVYMSSFEHRIDDEIGKKISFRIGLIIKCVENVLIKDGTFSLPGRKALQKSDVKYIENVIGFIKRFKILVDRYRNLRKRFGLRFNLIFGICNFDMIA